MEILLGMHSWGFLFSKKSSKALYMKLKARGKEKVKATGMK